MTLTKRYDFVLLFDVQDGNPNGDPDAGNLPRTDPETGHGLVTDVCLKRKLRNYVLQARAGQPGFDIFVKEKSVLNQSIDQAYADLGIDLEKEPADPKNGKKRNSRGEAQGGEIEKGRMAMCERYFDVRAFGAVMSTGANAGQVRGPVQLTFSRSIDPVLALEHSITRMAVTNERDAEKERTMGRKATLPYALYRAHGFVNPNLAAQTGFNEGDLDLLWEGLAQMFEHDRSAARGMMTARKLVVFEHASTLGNASAASLFDRLAVTRKEGVDVARSYQDYKLALNKASLPEGITVHERF
jgi:CRISPR-associated protein Csd2